MTIEIHDFMYGSSFLDDAIIPRCSCGWEGRPTDTIEAAREAWEDHCEAVLSRPLGRLHPRSGMTPDNPVLVDQRDRFAAALWDLRMYAETTHDAADVMAREVINRTLSALGPFKREAQAASRRGAGS